MKILLINTFLRLKTDLWLYIVSVIASKTLFICVLHNLIVQIVQIDKGIKTTIKAS